MINVVLHSGRMSVNTTEAKPESHLSSIGYYDCYCGRDQRPLASQNTINERKAKVGNFFMFIAEVPVHCQRYKHSGEIGVQNHKRSMRQISHA